MYGLDVYRSSTWPSHKPSLAVVVQVGCDVLRHLRESHFDAAHCIS